VNVYEVSSSMWLVRVKSSSAEVAISRGLKSIGKKGKANINSRDKKIVHVTCKVIARDVARDAEVPPFEKKEGPDS
jgi:hypothetical protein